MGNPLPYSSNVRTETINRNLGTSSINNDFSKTPSQITSNFKSPWTYNYEWDTANKRNEDNTFASLTAANQPQQEASSKMRNFWSNLDWQGQTDKTNIVAQNPQTFKWQATQNSPTSNSNQGDSSRISYSWDSSSGLQQPQPVSVLKTISPEKTPWWQSGAFDSYKTQEASATNNADSNAGNINRMPSQTSFANYDFNSQQDSVNTRSLLNPSSQLNSPSENEAIPQQTGYSYLGPSINSQSSYWENNPTSLAASQKNQNLDKSDAYLTIQQGEQKKAPSGFDASPKSNSMSSSGSQSSSNSWLDYWNSLNTDAEKFPQQSIVSNFNVGPSPMNYDQTYQSQLSQPGTNFSKNELENTKRNNPILTNPPQPSSSMSNSAASSSATGTSSNTRTDAQSGLFSFYNQFLFISDY